MDEKTSDWVWEATEAIARGEGCWGCGAEWHDTDHQRIMEHKPDCEYIRLAEEHDRQVAGPR